MRVSQVGAIAVCVFVSLIGFVNYATATVSDGFDYPVGIPDSASWWVAQGFEDGYDDCHLGEDWNWGSGTDDLGMPVYAVANGRVTYIDDPGPGWNGVVIIDHGPMSGPGFLLPGGEWASEVASMYAHLDPAHLNDWVEWGDYVHRGQQIGIIGPTAVGSTAPHLHFELRTNTDLGDFSSDGVGPGYSCNSTTRSYYTDPSDFIDLNRPGPLPLVGDWDGDGYDEIGSFEPGRTGALAAPPMFSLDGSLIEFGQAGDYPLVGDWDDDGRDEIGLFRVYDDHAYFYLDLDNSGGIADKSIFFAYPQDIPLAGDWDGDDDDDLGGYDPHTRTFYLYTLSLAASVATSYQDVPYGQTGDCPIVGDWDGDGDDDIGVARPTPSTYDFYLDLDLTGSGHELGPFNFGDVGDIPITGDLDSRGYDRVGINRPSNGVTVFAEFPNPSPGEIVHFPDPGLEAAIRDAIGKPTGDIHDIDLIGLTELDASERSIENLEGIQHCVDMENLHLSCNLISDLNSLSPLTKLRNLELYSNYVSDINPLSGLANLYRLMLGENQIGNTWPLASLTHLIQLGLGGNNLSDITALAGLSNLEYLDLWNTGTTNISALASLTNLVMLTLDDNPLGDISKLANLTNLARLTLTDCGIEDVAALSRLTNLTELYLDRNRIVNILPLSSLTNLIDLSLGENEISNITTLSAMTNLTMLSLNENQISNIAPLVNNAGLGSGDDVDIQHNYLDLTLGSDDMQNIQALVNRGVNVEYEPQNSPDNEAPTAHAGSDQTVSDADGNGQEDVTLDGSESDDPDGDIVSWTWAEGATQIATGEAPNVSLSVGEHTITLTVTDNEGATDTDTVLINVQGSDGFLTGRVIEVDTGNGLEATLDIEELGLCYTTEADGSFSLQLPQGTYTITAFAEQHDPRTRTCEIQAGETTTLNFGVFLSPLWRRDIQVGDILYDPRALGSLGHTGIYIGWGQTADPGPTTVVHHISTWDYPARNEVRILRVDAPLSIRSEAAWWAWDLGHRLDSSGLYKYQWQYINKNPDAESNRWYCSELVWAAYWNQGINIEEYEGIPLSLAELLIRPVSPDDVCEDDDTITVGGHCRGVTDTAPTGCCGLLCGECPIVEISGGLLFKLACPADLEVIDPLGRSISPTSSEIPGVVYMLNNEKREGEKYDIVAIPNPIGGSYEIHIIPEPGASPDDTYTLSVQDTVGDAPTMLADDIPIADIPAEGYEVEATCSPAGTDLLTSGWHMVSVPGELCDPCTWTNGETCGDLVCALSDDLDPCYIFHYDPGVGGYVIAPPTENICYHPGMGFWTRTYEDNVLIDVDVTVPTDPVERPLANGWNQIGNPFTFSVSLDALRVSNGEIELSLLDAQAQGWVSAYLFGYDTSSGGYLMLSPPDGCLEAWHGYWLRTYRDDCVLTIPPEECSTPMSTARISSMAELRAQGIEPPPPPIDPMSLDTEEVLAGLSVSNVPNPVRSEHTTAFKVQGAGAEQVEAIALRIYDLSGALVYEQEVDSTELDWHTDNSTGELLSNGTYLYQIWVKIGEIWYPTGIQKVVVLR